MKKKIIIISIIFIILVLSVSIFVAKIHTIKINNSDVKNKQTAEVNIKDIKTLENSIVTEINSDQKKYTRLGHSFILPSDWIISEYHDYPSVAEAELDNYRFLGDYSTYTEISRIVFSNNAYPIDECPSYIGNSYCNETDFKTGGYLYIDIHFSKNKTIEDYIKSSLDYKYVPTAMKIDKSNVFRLVKVYNSETKTSYDVPLDRFFFMPDENIVFSITKQVYINEKISPEDIQKFNNIMDGIINSFN